MLHIKRFAHTAIITCAWVCCEEGSMCTCMKSVCKASLCVTACCFHISIIGWELRGLSSLYWSPNARFCATAACGMISSPWSSHLMTITVAFVHRGSLSLSLEYSESLNATGLFSHHMPQTNTNGGPLSSRLVLKKTHDSDNDFDAAGNKRNVV